MAAKDPDVVVFMVGANDAYVGMPLDTYRQRVAAVMDQLSDRRVIWVSQPNMGRADLAAAIPPMNEVYAQEAAARPWVTFVDAWVLTSDASGAYPHSDPATPADITATVFHALGFEPETLIRDQLGRPMPISHGRAIETLLA